MKLSDYAKNLGISYRTAWRYFKQGKLDAYQTHTGTIIIKKDIEKNNMLKVAIYCRVSSSENRDNLERQKQRLLNYCSAKGYRVNKVITEIGSGINDTRKQWLSLLKDKQINLIVIEYKDRFTRFGFSAMELLLENENRKIEIINEAEDGKEDLMQDFISIITSFCARIYGLRRSKEKLKKIIKELKDEKKS
ncbi:MAG: IS607 family transposase [Actinobacteria bacterium]|nr:IS607 family transposase [Actinomycetota bacterium]